MKISEAWRVAVSPYARVNTPPRVDDSRLVLGDAQVPFQDADFINKCKAVAFAYGVRNALFVGDMIDLHAVSVFLSQIKDPLSKELDEDEIGMTSIVAGFDEVLWSCGNHDERLSRMFQQWLPMARIAAMLRLPDNVKTTNYFHCELGDKWIATHPKNSSVIPARIPSMLALKYYKNVISFHGHLVGAVQMNDYWCIDAGVTCDPARLEYSMVRQSTRPKVQRGAVLMLKSADGEYRPRLLNDLTDWEFEEKAGELWQKQNAASAKSLTLSRPKPTQSAKTQTRKPQRKSIKRVSRRV